MKKLVIIILSCVSFSVAAQTPITWMAGMNIAANSYGNMHPRIVTDANENPVVIWGRMSDQSLFISRWNGTAFTMPVKVNPTWMTIATQSWQGPHIASKGDTLYVVMKRTPEASDTNHVYIVRSLNGGLTFSAPVQVDNIADSVSRFPTVTIDDNGNPIVGFMKFDPLFGDARWVVAKSTDLGNTFSTDVPASGWSGVGATVCDCCPGAIACSNNTVAMLYRDNNSNIRDTWAGISANAANSFSGGMGIDQQNWMLMMCPSSGPDGVIIGDTLYSTFMNGVSGMNLVYFSKASVSSMTGSAGIPVTGMFAGLTQQNYPRIASSGNALAVIWKQVVSGTDQLALQFTNNLANGLPAAYDTVDLANVTNADVAITDGNIFVVWQDDGAGTVKYRTGTFIPTGIFENQFNENQEIFLNPVAEQLIIPFEKFSSAELFTIGGEKVLQVKQKITDVSSVANGFYLLKIILNENILIRKIIVQHK
ncbi:MAG: hypothetical protein ACHQNT_04030 [Bacteroidia bacterium]